MRKMNEAMVPSRTGDVFRVSYEVNADDSLSVVSADKNGFASAHLALARTALGGKIRKVIDHSWRSPNGVMTRLSVYRLAGA